MSVHAHPLATSPPPLSRFWFVNPLAWLVLAAIAVWRRSVPARLKPACRYRPTCSEYMALSVRRYGLVRGVIRGRQRWRRCIGFVPGGEDWP